MTTKVCTFKLRNVTPGALRYEQTMEDERPCNIKDSNAQLIGTLYVRKAKMDVPHPETLRVTVEY